MIPDNELVVLDTNVLVHLIRRNAIGERIAAEQQLRERRERPIISIVTVGELRALTRKLGWGTSKVQKLDDLVHQQLVIVNLNQGDVLERYAEIDYFCEKVMKPARPMAQNDMWIAATASAVAGYLITTDVDFEHLTPRFIKLVKIDAKTGATA